MNEQNIQQQAEAAAGKTPEEIVAQKMKEQRNDMVKEQAKSMAAQELNSAVSRALPNEVSQLRSSGLRSIPVLGSILQWFDNISWIRSLFGGRK